MKSAIFKWLRLSKGCVESDQFVGVTDQCSFDSVRISCNLREGQGLIR